MQIIEGKTQFLLQQKSAVAIGKFDGIHRGHKKLLQSILSEKENGLQAVIFTFDPPANVFFGGSQVRELTTREEKRKLFQEIGIDVLVEFPLNHDTAAMKADTFVRDILVKQMQAAYIAAGMDVSFGYKAEGDYRLLQQLGAAYGYEVKLIDKVCHESGEISSTYVREEVIKGDMPLVETLLGHPYKVKGRVVHGRQIGRTLGMPTVNLMPAESKLLPPRGVYYSNVIYDGKKYKSITNIGMKPTVSDIPRIGVETYLYDFEDDVYGEELTVELLEFKRPEIKFDGIEQLKQQMQTDIREGRAYFAVKEAQSL